MAENKKSFLLYCDLIHTVDKMPDEKAGLLLKHILQYVNDLNPETSDLIIQLTFEPIKQQLKRDLKKYYKICDRNKENGKKGGRPVKQYITENPEEPKKPNGLFGNPEEPKKPDTDTDTDTDNDIDSNIQKNTFVGFYISEFNKVRSTKFRTLPKNSVSKLKNALKNYSIDEIIQSYKNAIKDQFHIDSGFIHLTPEFFTRIEKIEKFLNYKPINTFKGA